MADIELVIKIPEGLKKDFESEQWTALSCMEMKYALKQATQLPKGHGRIADIDKILEETNCEYCHEDSDGYVTPIEKNGHAFVRFGMNGWELSLKANGWHGSAKIMYCPMCGRELKHG